ncbi:MAG: LPS-assembly protein LptD [Desulfuromonadales bacterium]|nr:LPS-assembly protein LptD [Desulfuromonadales bacterium]
MLIRIIVGILLFVTPGLVLAADFDQVGKTEVPVLLEADQLSLDKAAGVYRAQGNVKLVQGDLEVHSQTLEWNMASGEVVMTGEVELLSPDEELSGTAANYNLKHGTGKITAGHFFLREQNFHLRGESIERLGKLDYRIKNGIFTTCDGEVPAWKFGASQVDVTLGGYARARHTVFYLNDIPALYFPYMIYPAKTERESGLMIPTIGYSSSRGFQYGAAYYQVLGVNQDATLYLDYLSDMGLGKGLEYRYVFGQTNGGEARVYHIDVDKVDGVSVDEERYALEWQHDGWLPGDVRMVADVEYVNDHDYFEDFGTVAEEYNKDKVQSVFSLRKNWGKYNLIGQMKYTKDLEIADPTTLQLYPRITFDATRQRLGESIFYYALESEYTNFWRREGLRGNRLMARPIVSTTVKLWDVIAITPQLSYRERFYWGLNDDSSSEYDGLPEFVTRANTRLQKIYTQPLGFSGKLRHIIEPELVYRYIPDVDQTHLPDFDIYDRIEELNQIEYALVQRFTLRSDHPDSGSTYRDLLYLRISQPYDLTDSAPEQRFLDLRLEMKVLPTTWFALHTDTTLDVDSGEWVKVAASVKIGDKNDNSVTVQYHYDAVEDINYGAVDLSVAFLKPFYLNYQQRYEFATNEQLEQVVGIEYRRQCWSALLSLREHDDEQAVMLTFTMRGIGSVGGVGSSFGGI